MKTFDLNKFYESYRKNAWETEFEMIIAAARDIFKGVQEEYLKLEDLENLESRKIYRLSNWCGLPFFNDCGIFEQIIKKAANMVCEVYK